jgi:cell division protein FtsB
MEQTPDDRDDEIARLRAENERLREEVEKLKALVEELRRAGKRQAARRYLCRQHCPAFPPSLPMCSPHQRA